MLWHCGRSTSALPGPGLVLSSSSGKAGTRVAGEGFNNSAQGITGAKLSVAFILLPEFTMFAFSGFIDALRIAGDKADHSQQRECRWTVIAPSGEPIRANCGVKIIPWEPFPDPASFDYLVVVGGQVAPQRRVDPKITTYLHRVADCGGTIIGVCTASFVLAREGLMKGRKCCVHWYHRPEFEQEFPDLDVDSDTVFLEDRDRITCAGGRSAADVALYLIERHCGAASARKTASGLVIEEVRNVHTPQPHSEASWFAEVRHPLIRRTIVLMDRFMREELSIKEIADRLRVSENTLYRTFAKEVKISPARLFRTMRLAHGHWSLHHTNMSISRISHDYGFADASHFTRIHRDIYGITPARARHLGPEESKDLMEARQRNEMMRSILAGGLFIFPEDY